MTFDAATALLKRLMHFVQRKPPMRRDDPAEMGTAYGLEASLAARDKPVPPRRPPKRKRRLRR